MCSAAFSQSKLVALSFDDGPNTSTTVQMLDVLKKHNVKASFFVIGKNINEESAKVMVRAHNEGHDIENHSKTHSSMPTLSADSIKSEIEFTSALVAKYVGERPQLFRPPYIALNQTMFDNIDLTFICGEGSNDWEDNVSADQRGQRGKARYRRLPLYDYYSGSRCCPHGARSVIRNGGYSRSYRGRRRWCRSRTSVSAPCRKMQTACPYGRCFRQ